MLRFLKFSCALVPILNYFGLFTITIVLWSLTRILSIWRTIHALGIRLFSPLLTLTLKCINKKTFYFFYRSVWEGEKEGEKEGDKEAKKRLEKEEEEEEEEEKVAALVKIDPFSSNLISLLLQSVSPFRQKTIFFLRWTSGKKMSKIRHVPKIKYLVSIRSNRDDNNLQKVTKQVLWGAQNNF